MDELTRQDTLFVSNPANQIPDIKVLNHTDEKKSCIAIKQSCSLIYSMASYSMEKFRLSHGLWHCYTPNQNGKKNVCYRIIKAVLIVLSGLLKEVHGSFKAVKQLSVWFDTLVEYNIL